ncbi:MAG: hypothetical protein R6U95_09955, partial [Bacteroidales bacterium]
MKTKISVWMPVRLCVLTSLFFITNCTKNDVNNDSLVVNEAEIPVVYSMDVTDVTYSTATSGGIISSDDEAS